MLNFILRQLYAGLKPVATFGKIGLFLVLVIYVASSVLLGARGLNDHNGLIEAATPWMFAMALVAVGGDLVRVLIGLQLRQVKRRAP